MIPRLRPLGRREASLRRQALREADRLLGGRPLLRRWWEDNPRRLTMAIAGAAAAASLLPYEFVVPQLPYHAHVDSLLTVVVGMWAVEAALFALTAAVTAILINISAEPHERTKWFIRYRASAFDATATLAIFTLMWTGALAALTMGAQADRWDYTYIIVSAFVLFAFDLVGISWLLIYSHILLATATSRRIPDLLAELRAAIRQAAIREVSIPLFEAWRRANGLATDLYDFGYPPGTHPLMARGPGFVFDVNLNRMGRWRRSLTGSIRPGVAAIARLSLNGFVLEGSQLGAIAADDADREGGFLGALVMRSGSPALDLDQTFKRLTDQAQAAATAGRLADFDAELEVLLATQREIFELTSKLSGARQTFVTSLAGWQPEIQFRISMHRLGRAVLSSESVDIVNRWLYFVQQMLVVTRMQRREDLQQIFHLWTQVATRQDIPVGWNYLERLSEYAKALDVGLQRAPTEAMIRVLATEAQQYLISLRHQLVRLAPHYFESMARIIDSVARGFTLQWSQQHPADQVEQLKKSASAELARRHHQFWLGYAGWLIHRVDRGWISEDVALERWQKATSRLAGLSEAYEAWKRLGVDDPYQWDLEADQEREEAAREQDHFLWGARDPHASTTLPLVLIGLRLAPTSALPPDDDASVARAELEQAMSTILDDPDRWSRYLGDLGAHTLRDRVEMLRERFKVQEHAASARRERAVDEASVESSAVAQMLDGFVQGVDAEGLTLFRRLKDAGNVVEEATNAEMASLGYRISVPKISLIPSFSVPSVFFGLPPLYEQEDILILGAAAPTPTIGTSYDEVARHLDAAIDGLQGRGTPADLVIVPNDWMMAVALLRHDGQAELPGPGVNLGTYRGVPLLNGPAWSEDSKTCFVVSLPALARLHVWTPPVDADVRHGRVVVELRAPATDELGAARQQPPPESPARMPYGGDDLEVALRNQWRLRVEEHLRVEVLDPGAIAAVRYEPGTGGTNVP